MLASPPGVSRTLCEATRGCTLATLASLAPGGTGSERAEAGRAELALRITGKKDFSNRVRCVAERRHVIIPSLAGVVWPMRSFGRLRWSCSVDDFRSLCACSLIHCSIVGSMSGVDMGRCLSLRLLGYKWVMYQRIHSSRTTRTCMAPVSL